jgi:hypothetical protein
MTEYKKPIYHLQYRAGDKSLYHLIVLNLGGLYLLPESYIYLENKDGPTSKCIDEAFFILRDKFTLIKTLPEGSDPIPIFGETCEKDGVSDNPHVIFPFLRELFLTRVAPDTVERPKRFFIGRKDSFKSRNTHSNTMNRCILNEDHFIKRLKDYNIETIYLEDYTLDNKIRLFNAAELILSTNSSALTCALWCNMNTTIIELGNISPHTVIGTHYQVLCNVLGIKYFRYKYIVCDDNDNFVINDDDDIYEYLTILEGT